MIRIATILALILCAVPCFAQQKKERPAKSLAAEVGSRFEVVAPFIVAADTLEVEELQKSVNVKDEEGIAAMVAEKRAFKIEPGVSLVVLELHGRTAFLPVDYCDCRFVKDGKAIGKFPMLLHLLTDKYLKPLPMK